MWLIVVLRSNSHSIEKYKNDDKPIKPLCFNCLSNPKTEPLFRHPKAAFALLFTGIYNSMIKDKYLSLIYNQFRKSTFIAICALIFSIRWFRFLSCIQLFLFCRIPSAHYICFEWNKCKYIRCLTLIWIIKYHENKKDWQTV